MKTLTLFLLAWCISGICVAQSVGIGTTTPDASAQLDISSTTKGMLAPRMTMSQRDAITSPATGLLIYQTDNTPGFYYYNGTVWTAVSAGSGTTGWLLTGNAGTNPSTNFIGTTDNVPLIFKVNNLRSGRIDPLSSNNSSFGYQSLYSITTGGSNTAMGNFALSQNTEGYYNTANGYSALYSNISGYNNTAIGYDAIHENTTGYLNTAIGSQALYHNQTGANNVANGYRTLYNNTTGYYNTANGSFALNGNITGTGNTATGYKAFYTNTGGGFNTANGYNALYGNTTGSYNTASGESALFSNTTGYSNVAIGTHTLYSNISGSNLVAIGDSALFSNAGGYENTAVGSKALYSNTTGYKNTALGSKALYSNTTGDRNIAVGDSALSKNTTGNANTAIGNLALTLNTTGYYNTATGFRALINNTSGFHNTANGFEALYLNTMGYDNTAFGFAALGNNLTGYHNTALGYKADMAETYFSNATAIGANAQAGASNTMVLGSINGVFGATADVNVGIGTTTPDHALEIAANSSLGGRVQLSLFENGNDYARLQFGNNTTTRYWHIAGSPQATAANSLMNFYLDGVGDVLSLHGDGNAVLIGTLTQNSDMKLKTNILPISQVLSSVLSLNGYRYQWKDKNRDQSIQIGLLAQEVQQYFPELVKQNDKGILGVNYSGLVPVVIEAMKEQEKKINQQEKVNQALQKSVGTLQKENEILKQQIKMILKKMNSGN